MACRENGRLVAHLIARAQNSSSSNVKGLVVCVDERGRGASQQVGGRNRQGKARETRAARDSDLIFIFCIDRRNNVEAVLMVALGDI
jgi:hypothetical protein